MGRNPNMSGSQDGPALPLPHTHWTRENMIYGLGTTYANTIPIDSGVSPVNEVVSRFLSFSSFASS
jgi:hypothetical protein